MKPNLRVLGPRLGKELGAVRAALAAGDFEELGDGRFRVLGLELEPDDVIVERAGKDGWAVASLDGVTVALDTALDDELASRGPGQRARPPGQLDAQGRRSRAHRPDRADDSGGATRTCSSTRSGSRRRRLRPRFVSAPSSRSRRSRRGRLPGGPAVRSGRARAGWNPAPTRIGGTSPTSFVGAGFHPALRGL